MNAHWPAFGIGLLIVLTVTTSTLATEDCVTGAWGEWSKCTSTSKHCSTSRSATTAYSLEDGALLDRSIEIMNSEMSYKTKLFGKKARSRSDGSAPELVIEPECGPFKCVEGLAGVIPCSLVDQLDFLSFSDMGYHSQFENEYTIGNDLWGWTDPENGDEYAIMGLSGGTTFVRITDPVNPIPVGVIYTETTYSSWRDIKVIGNYAYIVAEAGDHGLQVFDLTHLRGVKSVQTFLPDATHKGFGNSHNLVVNEATNTVISVGSTQRNYNKTCSGGLYILNVDNPLQPRYEGCFGGDGYVHDAQCVTYAGPDKRYTGKEICFSFDAVAFSIIDITNRKKMKILSRTTYDNVGYTHQGWLTEDMSIVVMDDELDELCSFQQPCPEDRQFTKTFVWDVTDLKKIKLKAIFESPERSIDHNQYTLGNLVFQANYEAGLRILHLDQPNFKLTQVGYFDVLPSRTMVNFAGAWSVFPYFPSGTVAISSIDYGLFLVKPDYAAIEKLIKSGQETAQMTRTRPIVSAEEGAHCPPLVETKTCDAPKPQC